MFVIFGRFGHVQTAAFLLFSAILAIFRRVHFLLLSAILAMFRQLQFYHFWPFWPCSDGCICIIFGHFGHVQAAAFVLFLPILAMLTRLYLDIFLGRFGHDQAAAL